jgi:hypothetical protein
MGIYSNLRRNIVESGGVYKIKDLFGGFILENQDQLSLLDDPEFYDISTKTLKLGNLCARDIKGDKTPTINMGGQMYTTYCALAHLSNILEPNLIPKFHYNIDKIYNFLRRDLRYDNRVKFHSLLKTILEYDDPANTMNIIVDFIEDTDSVDEIAVALDRFRKSENIGESDIDEFLRIIKSAGHQEYEQSFYGDHFQKHTTRLNLKFKTEEENRSILERVEDVIDGKYNVDKAVSILYNNINKNYTPEEMVKSDLKCIKDVYDENGDVIINDGDYLEVKKIDYAADSYLSEFMAMYKSSRLPDYAHEPKFIKTYNQIIDGLYDLFKEREDIIQDIKKNFAGIIYDDKIFISNDDVELYWSNKGRPSCLKDHRLSIRYRLKKPNVIGYVYEGGDVLKEKPVKVSLSSEKVFCPIIKSKEIKESFNLSQISNLLLEGRKEDARKKYPKHSDEIFNYYVENDPSGNQKYLDWLLKNTNPDYKAVTDINKELLDMIKLFHQYQSMFYEKDINKQTFDTLDREVDDVKERLLKKKEEKQAKKEKTIIYSDDRWLVVSPHSWKASCYYGAGTKWCVTSKDTARHWNSYSKRASFFFVIDKTKNQNDPLYKVAYRVIGHKGKYELWDAEDLEISKNQTGREWFEALPNEIRERSQSYHEQKFTRGERPDWLEDDPRAQALADHLSSDDIEDLGDYRYGMPIYKTNEEYWVVGDSDEMGGALYEYYDNYDDNDLIEYYGSYGYYLEMDDEDGFIDNEVDYYLDELSDKDALEYSGRDSDYSDVEDEIEELRSRLEDLDSEEDEEEIDEIESDISDLESRLEGLIEDSRESYADSIRSDWERCFRDGPVECLVNEKGHYSVRDLIKSGLVSLDRDGLIDSIVGNVEYDPLTPYGYDEEQDDDGYYWYVFQIDY